MTPVGPIYAYPKDELLQDASSVTLASGTPLTSYDVDKLNNGTWAEPLKVEETSLILDISFASAVAPALVGLLNSNLSVAATLKGDSATNWGAPEVGPLTFGVPVKDVHGRFTSPYLDLTVTAKVNWRLEIASNALPIVLGGLAFYAPSYQLERGVELGSDLGLEDGGVVYRTTAGVQLGYEQYPDQHVYDGRIPSTPAMRDALVELYQACRGRVRGFPFVPDPTVDDIWWANWVSLRLPVVTRGGVFDVSLAIQEASRGLAWVDPDA